jgi:uncharacterized protein
MPVFVVTTAKGPNWDHARGIREQAFWVEHGAFSDELVARGVIILGGPISSDSAEDIALVAVEAADEAAVRSIFDGDPWMEHKVFRIKDLRSWTIWLDGRAGGQRLLLAGLRDGAADFGVHARVVERTREDRDHDRARLVAAAVGPVVIAALACRDGADD